MQDRVEFHISYDCLNNCIFCSERDQLNKFRRQFVRREIILKNLGELAKRGFKHVTFTGGDPTLHPNIIDLVRTAKNMGYKTYISSNGGLFSSKKFCEEIFPYLDEVCFSVHSHDAKLHNFLTRNKRSFARLKKALANMEKLSGNIFGFANIVVTKHNFGHLEKIINFVSRFKKIEQVLVSNLAPEGNGLRNFRGLSVPLREMKKKIPSLVKIAKNKKLKIRFFGLPLCALDGYEIYSNDTYWSPRLTIEKWKKGNRTILKRTYSCKPSRKKTYTVNCKKCRKKGLCPGVFEEYLKIFGSDDLRQANKI